MRGAAVFPYHWAVHKNRSPGYYRPTSNTYIASTRARRSLGPLRAPDNSRRGSLLWGLINLTLPCAGTGLASPLLLPFPRLSIISIEPLLSRHSFPVNDAPSFSRHS